MDNRGPFVTAFLSYSHHDRALAHHLCAALERAGIRPWGYHTELPLGHPIPAEIRRNLSHADYCVVLLTPASVRSVWVARELWLARQFHTSREPPRPQIIGVTAGLRSQPIISLREFDTATDDGSRIDFSQVRCLAVEENSDDELTRALRSLTLAVTWLSDGRCQSDVEHKIFACYEKLFPKEERDLTEDIKAWINEARAPREAPWERWSEYFAALHVNEAVLGVIYLSFQHSSQWCGGCYFGVRKDWRDKNRAACLLQRVTDRLTQEWPKVKGILFEIQMVDIPLLTRASRCTRLADFPDSEALKTHLRTLARLLIYQSYGCRTFVTRTRAPVNVMQPALQEPLTAKNEEPMMLMLLRVGDAPTAMLDPDDVLSFWYLDFYGQSHDSTTSAEIERYRDYVTRLKTRVVRQAHTRGFTLGVVNLPSPVRQLLRRAVEEGFIDAVEL